MADSMVSYDTFSFLMPEILLVLAAIWIYVSGTVAGTRRAMPWIAAMGIATAAIGLAIESGLAIEIHQQGGGGRMLGPVGFDLFGYAVRCLTLLVGILFVAMLTRTDRDAPEPELLGSLLLVLAGLMLVSVSSDLVLMFLGLELISIPTYILLFLGRRDPGSEEATLKYFFLSILASALTLYGFSFLYGVTGSLRLDEIHSIWSTTAATDQFAPLLVPVAMLLVVAGMGFKIAAVPFHFYAPDVYQGTTNVNAGLLAVVPKIAGIVALVRIGVAVLPVAADYGWQVLLVLAILTMTLGNVVALWQRNIRRLLAYSSIAHAGYMLIGLAVWVVARVHGGAAGEALSDSGLSATLLYLTVYVAASIGTFAALVYLGREGKQIDDVDELAGIGGRHRIAALALAIFMFSLAGIPPLAGFWGKLSLFASALAVPESAISWLGASSRSWFILLAIVGAINAAISAAYYLRVVSTMYFRSSERIAPAGGGAGAAFSMSFAGLLVVVLGVYPGPLVQTVNDVLPADSIAPAMDFSSDDDGSQRRLPLPIAETPSERVANRRPE